MLTPGAHFAVPLFVLPPHLGHPRCGAPLEFRVLLVSPGADSSFKGLNLTEAHQLLLGSLGKKAATATLTDQPVDLRGELLRNDNVSPFCSHDNAAGPPLDCAAEGPLQVYHLWDFRQPPRLLVCRSRYRRKLAGRRRAQLCASACWISAGDAHPQTPFCAQRPAIPHQQHLSPHQAS